VDGPPSPEAPPAGVVIVEGQITTAIGAGHADVTVTVHRKLPDGSQGELLGTATTDKMGDFAVRAPSRVSGPVIVTVTQPMFAPLVREFDLNPDEPPPFIGEELQGNATVIGRVIDALTRKPVAGAAVKLEAAYREWTATTDDGGEFSLSHVVPGKGRLIVEASRYGREVQPVAELENFGELLIEVKPERTLHLTIVSQSNQPIPGVTVECYDEPRDDYRLAVTDAAGSVSITGLHFDTGRLLLRLTHEDYVSSADFDRILALPRENLEHRETLVMPRAGTLTGRVTDKQTGKPVNGARLVVGTEPTEKGPRAWTDDRGQFTLPGVPAGQAVVTIHAVDYAPELVQTEVTAGQTANVEIGLGPAATLRGSIRDENDKPVPQAHVVATRWRGHATLGLRAVTDTEGSFVIVNAPADEFEVTVYAAGNELAKQTIRAGGEQPVVITVSSAALLADRVSTLAVGGQAPELKVTTLTGQVLESSAWKGKVVLVQFWATWCAPCVAELPHLEAVARQFGQRPDFVMLGISLDHDEKTLRDFVAKRGITWPQVFGETGGAYDAATRFDVRAIPAIFLLDAQSKIIESDLRGARIEAAVRKALGVEKQPQ